jgi:putative transposase
MMILVFKTKHELNIDPFLFEKAIKVAQFALERGFISTKEVKHIGLHSHISCQIIRKYGRNKTIKKNNPKHVKLTIPGQNIKYDLIAKTLNITKIKCLAGDINFWFRTDFTKINQVELDKTWAYVTVTIPDVEVTKSQNFIGIDLNSTSHSVVVANPSTGKVKKLGKQVPHIKKKYRAIRKRLQRQRKFKELKKIANREHRKTVDILHKLTTSIVKEAKENNTGIKIENLKGIRKRCTVKFKKQSNFVLNSWPFFMFKTMIEYKAKKWRR